MNIPAHWQAKIDIMDQLTGIDPDAGPNMADFIEPDPEARPAIIATYKDSGMPSWRSIAGVIRQGRKFGIEYLALTPIETRLQILEQLRESLPYAIFVDEGEGEKRQSFGIGKKSNPKVTNVWRVGIVLGVPGYGISDEEIEAHKEEFVEAARDFRRVADGLIVELMRTHDISLDTLPHIGAMAVAPGGAAHGHGIIGHDLNGKWNLKFQSGALFMTHLETGQEVRVSMYHGSTGGVLHGYGLTRFIKTTPRWSHLAPLLRDDYFDGRRVISVLHEQGRWEVVPRNEEIHLIGTKALAAPLA